METRLSKHWRINKYKRMQQKICQSEHYNAFIKTPPPMPIIKNGQITEWEMLKFRCIYGVLCILQFIKEKEKKQKSTNKQIDYSQQLFSRLFTEFTDSDYLWYWEIQFYCCFCDIIRFNRRKSWPLKKIDIAITLCSTSHIIAKSFFFSCYLPFPFKLIPLFRHMALPKLSYANISLQIKYRRNYVLQSQH